MTEAQHTGGPWRLNHQKREIYVEDAEGRSICEIDRPDDEDKANALLIAAAPELLEALEAMLCDVNKQGYVMTATRRRADEAIAKATGKQPS